MAQDEQREQWVPTEWVGPFARGRGAQVQSAGWSANDFTTTLTGTFGALPWTLDLGASLDTDYPPTQLLRVTTGGGPKLVVESGDHPRAGSFSELHVLAAVVSSAARWWRGRGARGAPDATNDATASQVRLDTTDPDAVLTDELLGLLESWPESHHRRSPRFAPSFRLSHEPLTCELRFETVQHWGPDACAHLLDVAERVLTRLAADSTS